MTEWPTVELGEVTDLLTGFPFKSASYSNDPTDIRLLRGDNIAQGILRWENAKRWPSGLNSSLDVYSLQVDDVVLAMDRPWIEAGLKYANVTTDDLPSLLVQRVARLRGTQRLSTRFLRYVIGSKSFTDHVLGIQTGTAVPHISGAQIKAYKFRLPPRQIQDQVVEVLCSLDDKIELNRRMNETLEAMAQGIFRDQFVDFGPTRRKLEGATDPVAIMGGLVQDAVRAQALADLFPATFGDDGRPEGWRAGRLDELAEVHMGASPRGDTYNEDGIGTPLANGPVEFGEYFLVEKKWTTSPTRLSQLGDFIICVRGSTTGRHVFADGVYCLGRGVAALRGFAGEQDFVNATIIMQLDILLQKTTGSVFPNLSGDDIRSFSCLIPPQSLRGQFSSLAAPLRQRIWHNIHENRTLAATRDLLLPKLMSGEIRLNGATELMEAAQ